MPIVKFVGAEGNRSKIFKVDLKVAKMFGIIENALEALILQEKEEPSDDEAVRIINVDADILEKVIEWAIHHKDDPIKLEESSDSDSNQAKYIDSWDEDFLGLKNGNDKFIFDITNAAKDLDVKGLFDVGCKAISSMTSGMTPEEVRQNFFISAEYGTGDNAQVHLQNNQVEPNHSRLVTLVNEGCNCKVQD